MKRLQPGSDRRRAQGGFIPMLIMLVLMLVAVMVFSYHRVLQAQH